MQYSICRHVYSGRIYQCSHDVYVRHTVNYIYLAVYIHMVGFPVRPSASLACGFEGCASDGIDQTTATCVAARYRAASATIAVCGLVGLV